MIFNEVQHRVVLCWVAVCKHLLGGGATFDSIRFDSLLADVATAIFESSEFSSCPNPMDEIWGKFFGFVVFP